MVIEADAAVVTGAAAGLGRLIADALAGRGRDLVLIDRSQGALDDARRGDAPYGSPEYGAAKAGLRRLTASLGARSEVRVTAVVPGWIGLDRAVREWHALPPHARADAGGLVPPDRVVDAVLRLIQRGRPGEVVELEGDWSPEPGC